MCDHNRFRLSCLDPLVLLTLSIPDEIYYRNELYALKLISTCLLMVTKLRHGSNFKYILCFHCLVEEAHFVKVC